MRFSLATLVLLVLWIGAVMWVWAWREPWGCVLENVQRHEFRLQQIQQIAPDRRRKAEWNSELSVGIFENQSNVLLAEIVVDKETKFFGFIDDDTLLVIHRIVVGNRDALPPAVSGSFVDSYESDYRRRFPEWWWGHFYRPEVWLALGLSAALIWRAARAWRNRRRNSIRAEANVIDSV